MTEQIKTVLRIAIFEARSDAEVGIFNDAYRKTAGPPDDDYSKTSGAGLRASI